MVQWSLWWFDKVDIQLSGKAWNGQGPEVTEWRKIFPVCDMATVLVRCSLLWQTPEGDSLEEGRFSWANDFRCFSPSCCGGNGRAQELTLCSPGSRERRACSLWLPPLSPFYSVRAPSIWDGAASIQSGSSPDSPSEASLDMPSWTHKKVSFINVLGTSQPNQLGQQD
jgi:hypothetical protein